MFQQRRSQSSLRTVWILTWRRQNDTWSEMPICVSFFSTFDHVIAVLDDWLQCIATCKFLLKNGKNESPERNNFCRVEFPNSATRPRLVWMTIIRVDIVPDTTHDVSVRCSLPTMWVFRCSRSIVVNCGNIHAIIWHMITVSSRTCSNQKDLSFSEFANQLSCVWFNFYFVWKKCKSSFKDEWHHVELWRCFFAKINPRESWVYHSFFFPKQHLQFLHRSCTVTEVNDANNFDCSNQFTHGRFPHHWAVKLTRPEQNKKRMTSTMWPTCWLKFSRWNVVQQNWEISLTARHRIFFTITFNMFAETKFRRTTCWCVSMMIMQSKLVSFFIVVWNSPGCGSDFIIVFSTWRMWNPSRQNDETKVLSTTNCSVKQRPWSVCRLESILRIEDDDIQEIEIEEKFSISDKMNKNIDRNAEQEKVRSLMFFQQQTFAVDMAQDFVGKFSEP